MVLVPAGGARRRDAPAGTPATPAAALCGRLFRLISSENGVENIRWHTNVFTDAGGATDRVSIRGLVLKIYLKLLYLSM